MKHKILSIIILVIAAGITAFAAIRMAGLGFDYDFENFFPRNDKDTDFFNEHRKRFGTDNDFVLIGLKNNEGIFKQDFLAKVNKLVDTLKTVNFVKEVVAITTLKETIRDPLMGFPSELSYLRVDQPNLYAVDSARIFQSPELLNNLVSSDGKSICIIIKHQEHIKDLQCMALSNDISSLQDHFKFDEYHLAGRSISHAYYSNIMKMDMVILLIVAFAVIILIMTFIYRSPTAVLLPVTVVALVVVWTMGLMEITGKKLDVMSNAVPTILVFTGLSVAVHVVTKYMDLILDGKSKFDALKETITKIGLANVLTTITTVVGFATLPTSGIKPIDDFGIYTAAGVIFSFVIGYTVLPAMLFLLPPPRKFGRLRPKFTWHNFLLTIFTWVINHKKLILGMFAGLIVAMGIGASLIREDTKLLEDLQKKSTIKKDFDFFENTYQGTRPFEMAVWIEDPDKTLLDAEMVRKLDRIDSAAREIYGLSFILSPLSIVKGSNRSYAGGRPEEFRIPESNEKLNRIIRELKQLKNNPMITAVITSDFKHARFQAITKDMGSNKAHKLDKKFDAYMKKEFSDGTLKYKVTGTGQLIDKNNRSLMWNMTKSMLIALACVSIIFLILFRSGRMVIIGLIPNLIPLVIMAGTMGYLGISFKMSTAILFTVAFGIAVDDTIHFLSKLRVEKRSDGSVLYALKRTYLTTGKSMIIMTLLLCAGFGVLALSSFQALRTIGTMISFTLFMAMINEIILMPVLIILYYKDNIKKRKKGDITPPAVAENNSKP